MAETIVRPPSLPEINPEEPKSKGKPKKKKLTKEEKKELKRQREIAFKKLELETTFERELELSRRTAKKLKAAWAESLRETKLTELKKELVIWEQKAGRQLTEKDEKIHSMISFISDMEEMNLLVSAKVKIFFNYLGDIYKALIKSSKILYEQAACESIVDFQAGLDERQFYKNTWRSHCENVMHATNLIFERELLNDYNIFVERRNDNVDVEIEKRYQIRDGIVSKMKASRQQLLTFVHQLTSTALDPHKYERIRQLMNRQRAFYEESKRLNDIQTKQTRSYNDLQRELLQSEVRFQKKINDLRLEQSYFIEIRRTIEEDIELDRKLSFEKLKIVSSESYIVLKHFEKLRDYGELLLSISANVRKLQTESEKVVIWGDFTPSENSKSEIEELRRFVLTIISPNTHVDRDDEELYNEMNMMRVFWRRMAIVETQNAMLNKEKLQLLAENKKYTDFIRSMSKTAEPEKLADSIVVYSVAPNQTDFPSCN